MDKQIKHNNHHDESKTRTHRLGTLPYDGDPWAPINLLKSGVFNPIMVDNYAALFNCTPVGWASDSMMDPT